MRELTLYRKNKYKNTKQRTIKKLSGGNQQRLQ